MLNSFDIFNGLKFNICNGPKLANVVDVLDIENIMALRTTYMYAGM